LKNIKLNEVSKYLDRIKESAYKDIAHLSNIVLNKNPYQSNLIHNYFFESQSQKITRFFLFNKIFMFYIKNIVIFFVFLINLIIFKLFSRKSNFNSNKEIYLLDIYFLADRIIKDGFFKDSYFPGLYKTLDQKNKDYVFFPRFHGLGKNPYKFYKLLKILNNDKKNNFLFEYEFLGLFDFVRIAFFIVSYPIKQFDLLQKENSKLDELFNYEIFDVLPNTRFETFTRYLSGKNISKMLSNSSKVISWQEFQNLEKGFCRAIRESNDKIVIFGCELLIKYDQYLSMHITDTDVKLLVTPHKTLLNGKYNYSDSELHNFTYGVSFRYKGIFEFTKNYNSEKTLLVLLGSDINGSQKLLKTVGHLSKLEIKLHPASNEKDFDNFIKENWNYVYEDLYKLFEKTNIVFISPMSGAALEAVACGISVIIIASKDFLMVNPLIEYGHGKIWDVVFDRSELNDKVNALLDFKQNNPSEIKNISNWYKNNFFIEPTEDNISEAFEL
jgi:hypothetical protein